MSAPDSVLLGVKGERGSCSSKLRDDSLLPSVLFVAVNIMGVGGFSEATEEAVVKDGPEAEPPEVDREPPSFALTIFMVPFGVGGDGEIGLLDVSGIL